MPDADSSSSISTSALYSAKRPPKKALVQWTTDQNLSLRACQLSRFLSLLHDLGPNIVSWHACQRYHSMPAGTMYQRRRLGSLKLFQAAWLSEQILTYFSGRSCASISRAQANITYTSPWKNVACYLEGYWAFYLQIAHRPLPRSPPRSYTHPCNRRAL
jgi:hypothetical protein